MTKSIIFPHSGTFLGQFEDYTLIDCIDCGFIHIDPLPTFETLLDVYDEQFYAIDKPEYLKKTEAEQPYWQKVLYQGQLEKLSELAESTTKSRKILEIGCSGGFFLRYANSNGWKTLGIEPSRQAADYARDISKIDVIQDYFQNLPLEQYQNQFDVVYARHVLEHIPNPIMLCQMALQVLKQGGIFSLVIPNDFNPLQNLVYEAGLVEKPYWVSVKHHLNYFNMTSLQKVLSKLGFEIIYEESTFPMEFFLLMGDNYVDNETVGSECHKKRMQFEESMCKTPAGRKLLEKLYTSFAELGIGRSLNIYARKSAYNE